MANIFDEIASTVPVHVFGALMSELERGNLTKAQIKTKLEEAYEIEIPTSGDDFDALNNLGTDVAAGTITGRHVEHAFILVEAGLYTRAEAKASLGQ